MEFLTCRYAQSLPDAVNRVTPSFNHSAADHVPWVANLPPVTVKEAAKFDEDFRDRWRSLMSVDDLVEGEPPCNQTDDGKSQLVACMQICLCFVVLKHA